MALYLVTGGGGFIGSNIVEALVQKGEKVRVLDNFATGKRENILSFQDNIELIEGDIRSYHVVRKAVDGVDFILHQAALPSIPRSIKDPITTNEVNVVGTLNMLSAAVDARVKRLVYASSSSIYGESGQLANRETVTPNPLSPYAVSKLAGEKYCQVFSRLYSVETVCLRYFNVFGPRQDLSSQYAAVIPRFIHALLNGQQPTIYGDGTQSRDFTYISNVVEANLRACAATNVNGEIFNVACGQNITIIDLLKKLNALLETTIPPRFVAPRPAEVKHSFANIQKLKQLMGYIPEVQVDQGLELTIKWFRNRLGS